MNSHFHIRPDIASISTSPPPSPITPVKHSPVSIVDVCTWLDNHGFGQYKQIFTQNEVTGEILKTLTSEELRDDLNVINLTHRRQLLDAITKLAANDPNFKKDSLPEHGRILDHLSNVRTYHSWIRVGVQLLGFSVVTLRLSPDFRPTSIVTACSFYFALVGIIALVYGLYRYRLVICMIERSTTAIPRYKPDRAGVITILVLILVASVLSITLISLRL